MRSEYEANRDLARPERKEEPLLNERKPERPVTDKPQYADPNDPSTWSII